MQIYFDNSSTTKPSPSVVEVIMEALTQCYGNPSSLHRMGVEVERRIKSARKQVAKALGTLEQEIVFTSGGTESNNLAIFGTVETHRRKGNTIITTKIEHPSVLNVFKLLESKGLKVIYLDVDEHGRINMEQLKNSVSEDTILISIMHVNNEVGSVQPVDEVGSYLKKKGLSTIFHVDGIQSFGKVPLNPMRLGADLFSLSGHKFYGPKGIGALYIRKGVRLQPHLYGGNQETGMRSGTENVPGIFGIGVAAEEISLGLEKHINRMGLIRESFIRTVKREIEDIKINGSESENTSPHILNISFLGTKGEVLLHLLEQDGIFISTGSACSAKKEAKSHVLKAMGLRNLEIEGALRFSFSYLNTIEEVHYVVEKLKKHVKDLRKIIRR